MSELAWFAITLVVVFALLLVAFRLAGHAVVRLLKRFGLFPPEER